MSDSLAPRRVLGVLVPYFNSVVEPELATLRPDGVSNQTARFELDANVLQNIAEAATRLSTCGPEALIIGLSTEPFPDGLALAQKGADEVAARTDLPVFTTSHATHAALRSLGVEKIGVVTPFAEPAHVHVRAAFESNGFDVVAIRGLACASPQTIAHTSLEDIRKIFRQADSRDAEAVVQVGTGLPVLSLVAELESELGKPVVACNAAVYWQALRAAGVGDRLDGFGDLFSRY